MLRIPWIPALHAVKGQGIADVSKGKDILGSTNRPLPMIPQFSRKCTDFAAIQDKSDTKITWELSSYTLVFPSM